jgi:hypothetical protein
VVVSIQKETALIKTLQNYDVAQKLNLKEKKQTKARKKIMPPALDNYGCFVRSDFF